MKIKYKKKSFIANLIMGSTWIGLFLFILFYDKSVRYWDYGYLVIGITYLGLYFYNKQNQYLEINDNTITKKFIPRKHFNLNKLSAIKRQYGDIKLLSETQKTLCINSQIIDEESLKELNTVLKSFENKIAS